MKLRSAKAPRLTIGRDALSVRLISIETDIEGVGVSLSSYQPAELSPKGDVLDALQEFNDAWAAGISTITENVSALRDRLADASSLYRAADGKLGSAARQGTSILQQDGVSAWHAKS